MIGRRAAAGEALVDFGIVLERANRWVIARFSTPHAGGAI
jgi:hypothetical protein